MTKHSPFIFNDPVIPPIFSGRDNELSLINKVLFVQGESMAIFGNDAIGKSSILKTIHTHLATSTQNRILPISINSFDFRQAVEGNFLGLVTHQICAAIWTRLMHRNYSELIEDSLLNVRGGVINSPEEKAIKRIFRIVTSEKLSGIGKSIKEIGGKFYIEGKISQENELTNERKPLAPFEFLHLLDELNDIIRNYRYDSLLIVCDEMNHLPRQTNSEFMRSYFDIFSSRKIQFLITIVNPDELNKSDAKLLLDSFNTALEIGHFKSVDSVQQLIFNGLFSSGDRVYFEKESFSTLFEITQGHPWWIQKICDAAYREVINSKKVGFVNSNHIEKSSKEFLTEMEVYREQIMSGQHFRFYHLGKGVKINTPSQ